MRIALIRQHFDAAHGGAEAYAVRLAQGLLGRGHELSLICVRANADDTKGCEVIKVAKGKWAGPWRHAAFAKSAGQAAQRSGAEVVISLARALPCDVFRLGDPPHHTWMKLKYGPVEALKKAKEPRHSALLKLETALMAPSGAKILIANSEFIKRQMMHVHGVAEERIHVLRNPVDRTRFSPERGPEGELLRAELGIADDELVVLFSGMDFERKGLAQAAQAFAKLCEDSPALANKLRFVVVGKGDVAPATAILRKAGCEQRMLSVGKVSDIERYYLAANVFVLPTLYDPAANAVGEALACGTPVVTTRMNGASELIRAGDNGMVIQDRNNIERLASAISRMLATERIQRSRQFVSMVRASPTLAQHLDAWEEILRERLRERVHAQLAAPPRPQTKVSQQVIAGRVVIRNESLRAEGILKRIDLAIPVACFEPRRERLMTRSDGAIIARYPVRGARQPREHLFANDHPASVFLCVDADNSERGIEAFHATVLAMDAGVSVATPLAAGSDGRRSFFAYADGSGDDLATFIGVRVLSATNGPRMIMAQLVDAVALACANFHNAEIVHGALAPEAFKVCLEATGEMRITIMDLRHAESFEALPPNLRALDLATLDRALPTRLIRSTDRLRFLRRYLQSAHSAADRRSMIAAIRKERADLERHAAREVEAQRLVAKAQNQGLVAATAQEVQASAKAGSRS